MITSRKFQAIKPSINELPHELAIRKILDIRESRKIRKLTSKTAKAKAKTPAVKKVSVESIQKKMAKMTDQELIAYVSKLKQLRG